MCLIGFASYFGGRTSQKGLMEQPTRQRWCAQKEKRFRN
jgi:hypothetical protein